MVTECGLCCNRYCDSAGTDRFVAVCSGYTREPQPKQPTNADRIRAMSDEDLAEFLTDCSTGGGWITEVGRKICHEKNLEWLKQPAEEET